MELILKTSKTKKLKNPILICGMPGSGYVGKLAAEHLIDEYNGKAICKIYSNSFPPQVIINNKGIGEIVNNTIYLLENKKLNNDFLILTGESQPITEQANYLLSEKILDYTSKLGVKKIFTLAAYITGNFVQKPKVFGTATSKKQVKLLKRNGISIMNQGMITGMNGILIGIAKIKGMEGYSLLGETSGYIIDPNSSKEVLKSLKKITKLNMNTKELSKKAQETLDLINQIENMKSDNDEGIKHSAKNQNTQYIS